MYARGDASKKGNLNTRIVFYESANSFVLEIANPLIMVEGKRNAPRITVPIQLPDKYFDEIVGIVMPDIKGFNEKGKPIETYHVYNIEIKRKKDNYYAHITYELDSFGSILTWNEKITSQYVAGIDVNVDRSALISRGLRNGFKIKKVNPAYTSIIGRFKYSEKYGLSVHEAASFVIGRRGLDFEELVPKALLKTLINVVKPFLLGKVGSMEEFEKKTKQGKQKIKFFMTLVKNLENFKENHYWKIWNVVNKTLQLKNQEIQLKEV